MKYRVFTYALAMVCAAFTAAPVVHAQDSRILDSRTPEPRAVIELFTSQGCSSCPAADKLLGELASDPSLVTLSLPVDYWDYLGWKDTLALRGHSERQRAYSLTRGDRAVYTPQVVINGVVHVLGSDKAAIEKAIARTRQNATPLTVPVTLKVADGKISVTIASGDAQNAGAEVWLCPATNAAPVAVGRGENGGRTLTYHNVVRRWIKLGTWSGKAENFSLPLTDLSGEGYALTDIDKFVVVVQSGSAAKPGMMLGAAQASLR
jgi:hypothetical protein